MHGNYSFLLYSSKSSTIVPIAKHSVGCGSLHKIMQPALEFTRVLTHLFDITYAHPPVQVGKHKEVRPGVRFRLEDLFNILSHHHTRIQ